MLYRGPDRNRILGFLVVTLLLLAITSQAQRLPKNPLKLQFTRPGVVLAIAPQDDGKLVIGGSFSLVNGVTRHNLARLNPDGSLDLTWNSPANDAVRQLAISGTDLFVMG